MYGKFRAVHCICLLPLANSQWTNVSRRRSSAKLKLAKVWF